MDTYSGYNQIKMFPPDEDRTTFTTGQGIFCCKVMPFGLKNAGVTFQRMVDQMFKDLIGHTMDVYVNGEYATKDERMEVYLQLVLSSKAKFPRCDSSEF